MPLTKVLGLSEGVKKPFPVITDQLPVPVVGAFASKLMVSEQITRSFPALAVVGGVLIVIVTIAESGSQPADVTTQLSTVLPGVRLVIGEVFEFSSTKTPEPLRIFQFPVPLVGRIALSAVESLQIVWFEPAFTGPGA
jgi:hypothetical protein